MREPPAAQRGEITLDTGGPSPRFSPAASMAAAACNRSNLQHLFVHKREVAILAEAERLLAGA